jgi:hypothetical protein
VVVVEIPDPTIFKLLNVTSAKATVLYLRVTVQVVGAVNPLKLTEFAPEVIFIVTVSGAVELAVPTPAVALNHDDGQPADGVTV